ncbi:hypothetical protein Dd1591_2178 [Dickeya chrysanthemi Ech1591]|uniref:Uncharacterized protein n=1 Tax=Dickeya chrysanthemi (strain Ech1591) TaxID=561229 RepID=C6CIH6_DICC1|nr:hypothetical protein Dd1591_2178 [Dickeya chrysanthemi Ech1591]
MSLALKGQRVALFKTQRVLSCNSNYFGYIHHRFFYSPDAFQTCSSRSHKPVQRHKMINMLIIMNLLRRKKYVNFLFQKHEVNNFMILNLLYL